MRALSRLRDGLVGAWCPSVSGWGGNVLRDLSGQGNHGQLVNMDPATDWVVSEGKTALDFDGVNDFVSFGDSSKLSFQRTDRTTWSAWIKPNDVNGVAYGVLDKSDLSAPNTGWSVVLFRRSALKARAVTLFLTNTFATNEIEVSSPDNSIIANAWQHVAVSYNGNSLASGVSIFISGIEQPKTVVFDTLSNSIISNISPIVGGRDMGTGQMFPGQLDDVRIYNRALSPNEIRLLASERGIGLRPERKRRPPRVQVAPTPPPVSNKIGTTKRRNKDRLRDGLVGAWCPSVSGWGGNLIKDLSGQGNHGTLIGLNPAEDWVIRTLPAINFPDFDATQYIGIPILARSIAPPFSISAWFRVASQFGSNLTIGNSASLAGYRIFMNNTWRAQSHDGVSQSFAEGSSVVLNAWVNVVAVFSANARRSITIAGFSTAVDTGSIAVGSCDYVRLGARGGSTPDFYAGQLDDARIYNRVLTEQEIRLLASERGIGLRPERKRRYVQGQTFTAARLRRQSLIGSGVY